MDIEFEGSPQGISAVRRLNEVVPRCQVVYLSNYLQYSVDVYRTDHVWFVLKSQFEQRLPEVFEKLARIGEMRRRYLMVPTLQGGMVKLACEDIVYLERRARITRVVARAGVFELREKLSEVAHKLPDSTFAFCHSSILVNMPHVTELHDDHLLMDNGDTVLVSRRYAKAFRASFFEWADQWTV